MLFNIRNNKKKTIKSYNLNLLCGHFCIVKNKVGVFPSSNLTKS